MNEPRFARLGDIAQVTMGQSPDSRYYNEEGDGYPFLQGCAQFGPKVPDTTVFCSVPAKLAPAGSILFSVRAPVGEINIADKEYCIGRGVAAIIPKKIEPRLLYYALQFVNPQFKRIAQGSTFEAVNSSDVANFLLPTFESREAQTAIADVLSTVDRAIEQTEALIAKYRRIKAGLMHDLLTRGIDENGNLRHPSTHKFKESPLGLIPAEWEVNRLERLTLKIIDGTHHTPNYVDNGVPFVTVKNLTQGNGIDLSEVNFISPITHKLLYRRADPKPGDVLVTKDGTLGIARIVTSDLPQFSIFVSVALLRPDPRLCMPELIWAFFESGYFEPQLGYLSVGTGLRHIHLEHFRAFQIATPPLSEQQRIFQFLKSFEERLRDEGTILQKLQRLKAGLMQDLLTGRVSVEPLLRNGNLEEA